MICVICAMDVEYQFLISHCSNKSDTQLLGDIKYCLTDGFIAIQSGIGMERAKHATQLILDHFPISLIISVGLAGSLQDYVDIGDVVISYKASLWNNGVTTCFSNKSINKGLQESIIKMAGNINVHNGDIVCINHILFDSYEKEKIRLNTGALCVDMESAGVFAVCVKLDIPFMAIKIISDTANENVSLTSNRVIYYAANNLGKLITQVLQ